MVDGVCLPDSVYSSSWLETPAEHMYHAVGHRGLRSRWPGSTKRKVKTDASTPSPSPTSVFQGLQNLLTYLRCRAITSIVLR